MEQLGKDDEDGELVFAVSFLGVVAHLQGTVQGVQKLIHQALDLALFGIVQKTPLGQELLGVRLQVVRLLKEGLHHVRGLQLVYERREQKKNLQEEFKNGFKNIVHFQHERLNPRVARVIALSLELREFRTEREKLLANVLESGSVLNEGNLG